MRYEVPEEVRRMSDAKMTLRPGWVVTCEACGWGRGFGTYMEAASAAGDHWEDRMEAHMTVEAMRVERSE